MHKKQYKLRYTKVKMTQRQNWHSIPRTKIQSGAWAERCSRKFDFCQPLLAFSDFPPTKTRSLCERYELNFRTSLHQNISRSVSLMALLRTWERKYLKNRLSSSYPFSHRKLTGSYIILKFLTGMSKFVSLV